jgi:hypothetical protein
MKTIKEILAEEAKKFSSPLTAEGLELLVTNVAIEFAKLHCIEQARVISEKTKMYDANEDCDYVDEAGNYPEDYRIDRNSILNAYSLDLIK